MAAISQQTFAEGTKKCLRFGGEEFVRPLAFGTNWNWLRLVMSYALTPNGTSSITGTRWVVSLISGTIQGRTYNSSNTTNSIGVFLNHTNESTGQTLTYNANSGNPYYSQVTSRGAYFTRVANSTTQTNFLSNGGRPYMVTTGGTIQRRAIVIVDWLKSTSTGSGTDNWNQRMGCTMDATNAGIDQVRELVYLSGFDYTGTSPYAGSGIQWTDLVNAAANPNEQANGPLDTLSIYWNQSAYPMEIYDLVLFRLS